jgi:hypothetical protein
VEQVLSVANEPMDRKNRLLAKGYNLETIADKVSSVLEVFDTLQKLRKSVIGKACNEK